MCLLASMQEFLTQFCRAYIFLLKAYSASILTTSMGIQAPSVDKSKIATACGIQTTEDAENLEIGKTM